MSKDPYACAGCNKDGATMDICEDGGAYCCQCKCYYCYDCFGITGTDVCAECDDIETDDIGEKESG